MSLKDKILGREDLKRRIASLESEVKGLEEEKEELKRKADKEEERAKEAVSKKQKLNEKINKQEDRIESLEDKLQKRNIVEDVTGSESSEDELGREEMKNLLSKIDSVNSTKEDLITVYMPPNDSINDLDSQSLLQTNLTLNQLKELKNKDSNTGKIFFHSKKLFNILVKSPLPVHRRDWKKGKGFDTEPLKKILGEKVGFVFLSAGGSGVAVFGDEVEDKKLVRSKIKEKHSKGGFSQDRFERSRGEDVKKHLDEVVDACKDILSDGPELLAVSGSQRMVDEFLTREFPKKKNTFERNLDLSKVEDEEDLFRVFEIFWKFTVFRI